MNTPKQSWEEEYERRFVLKSHAGTGLLRFTDADTIKDFLRETLTQQREEIVREVEGMKVKNFDDEPPSWDDEKKEVYDFRRGYNQAIHDIINKIRGV